MPDYSPLVPDLEGELKLSLPTWITAIGIADLRASLLADTAPSYLVLAWLAQRSVRRQRGEDVSGVGVDLNLDTSAIFNHLHGLRVMEPVRWRDVRQWWAGCPITDLYIRDLGLSQLLTGELTVCCFYLLGVHWRAPSSHDQTYCMGFFPVRKRPPNLFCKVPKWTSVKSFIRKCSFRLFRLSKNSHFLTFYSGSSEGLRILYEQIYCLGFFLFGKTCPICSVKSKSGFQKKVS